MSLCSAQSLVFVTMLISPEKCDKEMNLQFVMISRRIGRSCLYGTWNNNQSDFYFVIVIVCACVCVFFCYNDCTINHLLLVVVNMSE